MTYSKQFKSINILNHLDLFTESTKGKYYCPNCNSKNFSINKSTGAYNCFSGGEECNKAVNKMLFEIERPAKDKRQVFTPTVVNKTKFYSSSQLKEEALILASQLTKVRDNTLEYIDFPTTTFDGEKVAIRRYSASGKVRYSIGGGKCRPITNGKLTKNDKDWHPINHHHLTKNLKDYSLFYWEGEKDLTITQSHWGTLGLSLFSGGNEFEKIALIRNAHKQKVREIIFITDNDEAGRNKGNDLVKCGQNLPIKIIPIPIAYIWKDAPEKADISDYLECPDIPTSEKELSFIVEKINRFKLSYKPEQIDSKVPINNENSPKQNAMEKGKSEEEIALAKLRKLNPNTVNPENQDEFHILPGIFPKGTINIIAALPKVGKSLLAYDLVGALVKGQEYLGYKINQKNKNVLIIQTDESQAESDPRMMTRLGGFDDRINIINDFDLSEKSIKDFEIWVETLRPSLIVMDSLKSINGGLYNEDKAEIAEPLEKIKKIIQKYNSTVILIHHANKSRDGKGVALVRGSGAITAVCHSVLLLNEESSMNWERRVRLEINSRDSAKKSYCLEFNDEIHSYKMIDDGDFKNTPIEPIDLPVSKWLEKEIPQLISQGFNTASKITIQTDKNINTIRKVLKSLVVTQTILRLGDNKDSYYQNIPQNSEHNSKQCESQDKNPPNISPNISPNIDLIFTQYSPNILPNTGKKEMAESTENPLNPPNISPNIANSLLSHTNSDNISKSNSPSNSSEVSTIPVLNSKMYYVGLKNTNINNIDINIEREIDEMLSGMGMKTDGEKVSGVSAWLGIKFDSLSELNKGQKEKLFKKLLECRSIKD